MKSFTKLLMFAYLLCLSASTSAEDNPGYFAWEKLSSGKYRHVKKNYFMNKDLCRNVINVLNAMSTQQPRSKWVLSQTTDSSFECWPEKLNPNEYYRIGSVYSDLPQEVLTGVNEPVSPQAQGSKQTAQARKQEEADLRIQRQKEEAERRRLVAGAPDGMVFVKGGCFQMGDQFGDGEADEKPVHEVCVKDFYMDKYEVSQKDFQRVIGNNPSYFKDCGNCPVEEVTWAEAKDYCEKSGKRLPTEAEWEYAAREGGRNVRFGTGKDTIGPDEANFDASVGNKKPYSRFGEDRGKTLPVGSFAPNDLGLYDMSGNVKEWVSDWYDANYYNSSPKDNPQGSLSPLSWQQYRVLRGGSCLNDASYARAANRYYNAPDVGYTDLGFRCSQ